MAKKSTVKLKIFIILFTLILLTAIAGAGYIGFKQWWAQNQPRTSLAAMKINADVLRWSYGHIPELYAQLVALDDVIALIETELNRLKELGKKYPDQQSIVTEESEHLKKKRDELTSILTNAGKAIESIYVTYKINARKGQEKIGSKETYDLGKLLSATLKSSRRLVHQIKSQDPEKWTDKFTKIL